ncbi:type VI secretion system protein TssL [Motiliproteus coralliicola]|uniref:Type VI secretion system protein TssL n=1 Tax=Motiliproteus coralliicola TaxID=2283196 RepID=A0A369W8L3_9GAMM|nr:flagellar motor protein MotB [Motiliproteus coralliicola]RDE18330.1 type VI secretion system protein TssL [Motiliproteus coralliicola]
MSEEAEECKCPPPGSPAWMATFADLMSLLMCFFVLLLSFSEMDVLKFKQLAGSMREAFGVQNQIKAKDIPKGTSIIAQEFSPGRPEPTPLNEVRQFSTDTSKRNLDVRRQEGRAEFLDMDAGELQELLRQMKEEEAQQEQNRSEAEQDALTMALALQKEIGEGSVDVETRDGKVIIRVKEKGSFTSGAAELNAEFVPIISKIRDVLLGIKGMVAVEGHTDNIPISTAEFQSNWGLSAARALSVAQELFADPRIDQSRYEVSGYADSKPLVPNNSAENRSINRRVEIVIQKGKDEELFNRLPAGTGGIEVEGLDLNPSEIF